jgi:hypothetical protein
LTIAVAADRAGNRSRSGRLSADPILLCYLPAFLAVFLIALLTPPFEAYDEPQHFMRAFQLSELTTPSVASGKELGAMLPASISETVSLYIGYRDTRGMLPVEPHPMSGTIAALKIPLEPERRIFSAFSTSIYSPFAYLPQAVGVAIARAFDFGPVGLLYAARLVNGLVALLVTLAALSIMPRGRWLMLVFALLPMPLFQYSTASPDAAAISMSFLLTALGLRALSRGGWTLRDGSVAAIAGAIACSLKPVYAPLLLIALPLALRQGQARRALIGNGLIIAFALGVTFLWFKVGAPGEGIVTPRTGANVAAQLFHVLHNPFAFPGVVLETLKAHGLIWSLAFVGWFAWGNVPMPLLMYFCAYTAVIVAILAPREEAPVLNRLETSWLASLLVGGVGLIFLVLYLVWTPVGDSVVDGIHGRYFLPFTALLAALLASIPIPRDATRAPFLVIPLLIAIGQALLTPVVIVRAFEVL